MILVHQDLLNQEESKDNPQEHLPMETTKNTQIEAISEGLLDQGHQAKRYKVLICDIQQESLKEMPSNPLYGKSKKKLRKSPKRKMRGTQTSLEEPHRIIYTSHEGFIQGLASARSSFALTRFHHEALKLVLKILRKIGRENRKTK
jgi:hypothetical protein